jgi:AraC-like DNA-binding protein
MAGAAEWRGQVGGQPAYRVANIRSANLAGLIEAAHARGADPERWFAAAGLHTAICADPDGRLSYANVATIVHEAIREFPDAPLGLEAAARLTLPSLGVLGFSLMAAPDLSAAARVGEHYYPAAGALTDVRCFSRNGELILEGIERFAEPALQRFLCEKLFGSAVLVVRALAGADYRPLRLELRYDEPPCVADYHRYFGCPIRFNAPADRLYSDPSILRRRIATHSASAHAESLRLLQTRLPPPAEHDDIIEALRAWLRPRLGQAPRIADAARELRIGERTLRRRLAATRSSFRALHDELRAERAQVLLGDPRCSVAAVALELGYSDERELRRAYKRWTGHAPRGRAPA